MRTLLGATALALLTPLVSVPADAAGGRVTPAEFRRVADGMTRMHTERIMGAGRGLCTYRIDYGDVLLVTQQYRQIRGGWAAITYEVRDGRPVPRVEDKERNTTRTRGQGC